jgi:hypothetical protein
MDIHKPKPFHSLREFASEVVIVVVGVTIALAGEQAVDWLSWQHRAEAARNAISVELGESVGLAKERVYAAPCLAARLDGLARIVDQAAVTGRLPAVGKPPRLFWRVYDTDVWRSAQASQAAAHLSQREQFGLSESTGFVDMLREFSAAERADWTRLATLAGPDRPFPSEEAAGVRAAIADARELNMRMVGTAIALLGTVDEFGLRTDPGTRAQYEARLRAPVDACAPAGAAPPDSDGPGSAADVSAMIAALRAHVPITRPAS